MHKANSNYIQALIPLVKAMAYLKDKEYDKAGECIRDTFKTRCLNIKANIAGRRERIIKGTSIKLQTTVSK